jgi:hypothetical protein
MVVAGFVVMGLGFAGLCPADTIYFKNGRKMEGEVRRTPEGLWIEGGLFEEEEIERIEKGPSVVKEKDDWPWYNSILNKVGIRTEEENQGDTKAPLKNVSRTRQVSGAVNPVMQPGGMPVAPMGLPFLVPQAPQQPAYGQDFSALIDHAQQLQNHAQQRQIMMMQEMMEAEEGYPGDPATGSAGRGSSPSADTYDYSPPEYQKKGKTSGGYDDYDGGTKKKSGGKKFKTMDIDEYGNVSWE